MKASTIHSLLTARALYDEALGLIESNERHMCSAGLILLQDVLEIVFLSMPTEKDVDEKKNLESKSFDELMGELRSVGVNVPKMGTLKALNKQRVITKHYGQLAEPITVRGYAEAADVAISSILPQVLGKTFRDIFLSDLLIAGESRDFLNAAAALLDQEKPLEALIEIRKSLYVEIEHEYAIHGWKDAEPNEPGGLLSWARGGHKAPLWRCNKKWIEENVKEPVDYVQIDHEKLRLDAMEWGVNTAELENIRRLTPDVFRFQKGGSWHIQYEMGFPTNEATLENARYCLDRAISILLRKQQHKGKKRWPRRDVPFDPITIYQNAPVFERASMQSKVVHNIQSGYDYRVERVVTGFDPAERYYHISGSKQDPTHDFVVGWICGYLLEQEEDTTET